jgi:hypothetical protein
MKTLISRFIMITMWLITLSLSVYITFYRNNISNQDFTLIFIILVTMGVSSVIFSYIYLKFLSPISAVRDNIEEYVENNKETMDE